MLILQPFWMHWGYWRPQIAAMPWRLVSGHFVHLNWGHAILNVWVLLLLPFVFRSISARLLVVASVFLALFISGCFLLWHPDLIGYAGFSGVLHGLYILAALQALQIASERWIAVAVIAAMAGKLLAEQQHWLSLSDHLLHIQVMVDAHLYGAFGGICIYLVQFAQKKLSGHLSK